MKFPSTPNIITYSNEGDKLGTLTKGAFSYYLLIDKIVCNWSCITICISLLDIQ